MTAREMNRAPHWPIDVPGLLREHAQIVERLALVRAAIAELEAREVRKAARLEAREARAAARPAPRPGRPRRRVREPVDAVELEAVRQRAVARMARLKAAGDAKRKSTASSEPSRPPPAPTGQRAEPHDAADALRDAADALFGSR
jgi:hypothetical protein